MPVQSTRVCEVFTHPTVSPRTDTAPAIERGSGYLVGPRTVLTAGHVVTANPRRVTVRFLDDTERAATVVWFATGGPAALDAAVLVLDDNDLPEPLRTAEPVRFGRTMSSASTIEVVTLGFPRANTRYGHREVAAVTGRVHGAGGAVLGRGELEVSGTAPAHAGSSPWKGMSGAAVCTADTGLLLGIVAEDTPAWSHGRLTVEPIRRLLTDTGFARALAAAMGVERVTADAVELYELAHHKRAGATSPAQLLRAESQIVDFQLRDRELATLEQWCSGGGTGVMLIHGRGGQGKTRLALHWLEQLRARDWVCCIARADLGALRPEVGARVEQALAHADAPVLIMIDYAETWRANPLPSQEDPLVRFLDAMSRRGAMHHHPIRVLLVARSPGTWWRELTSPDSTDVPASVIPLEPLVTATDQRFDIYRTALTALARELRYLPGYEDIDWRRVAENLPPRTQLHQLRFGHALTLFEQALIDLLEAGPGPATEPAADSTHDRLLEHEARYWRRTAQAHGVRVTDRTQREIIAAATLFGADHADEATRLLSVVPGLRDAVADDRIRIVDWLRELYEDPYWYLGPLEPDRLGEHLVARVWGQGRSTGDPDLLELVERHLLERDDESHPWLSDQQIHRMFVVLDRASDDRELDRIRRTARSYLAFGRARKSRPPGNESAYRRMDVLKARGSVGAWNTERDDATALWRCRWAWWNVQRPARIVSIGGSAYLGFVELDGTTRILAVNSYFVYRLDSDGRDRRILFTSEATRFTAACAETIRGVTRIVIGLENGDLIPLGIDGTRLDWPHFRAPTTESGYNAHRVASMAMGEVHGRVVVVSSSYDGPPLVHDADSGASVAILDGAPQGAVAMVIVDDRDGPVLVTVGEDNRIRLYDLGHGRLVTTFESQHPSPVSIDAYHLDRTRREKLRVVVGYHDGTIMVLDGRTGEMIGAGMHGHSKEVSAVRVATLGDRPVVVSTGSDQRVVTWNLRGGQPIGAAYTGHENPIRALAVGHAGSRPIMVTSDDFTLRIWDMAGIQMPEEALIGHTESITAVAAMSDDYGHVAVTASMDKSVRVWDMRRGGRAGAPALEQMYPVRDYPTAVALCRVHEAITVVAGDSDGGVTVCTADLPQRGMWLEHSIADIACGYVGARVVMAAVDSTGEVGGWDARTGKTLTKTVKVDGGGKYRLLLTERAGVPHAVISAREVCAVVDLVAGVVVEQWSCEEFGAERFLDATEMDGRLYLLVHRSHGTDTESRMVRLVDPVDRGVTGVDHLFRTELSHATLVRTDRGTHIVATGSKGEIWIRELFTAEPHDAAIVGVAQRSSVNPAAVAATPWRTGLALLIGGNDGGLEFIDGKTGLPLIDAEPVNASAVTVTRHQGKPVAVIASGARKLVVRDLATGEVAGPPTSALAKLQALRATSSGERELLLGTNSLGVQVWDCDTMLPVIDEHIVNKAFDGKRRDTYGSTAVVRIGARVVSFAAHEGEIQGIDVLTGNLYGATIDGLPTGGIQQRVILTAAIIRDRPVVFATGYADLGLFAWDALTGDVIDTGVSIDAVHQIVAGVHRGREVLCVVTFEGLIAQWPTEQLVRDTWFKRRRRPRLDAFIEAEPDITATAIHPELGLIVARDGVLDLRPFDPDARYTIHLDAPIAEIACTPTSIVVACDQGVVVLDIDCAEVVR